MESYLTFKLSDEFIEGYANREVKWGFNIGGGNTLGELTFLTKYSRRKADGTKERWFECCRRVIEGMYSILKDHTKTHRTTWNELKAQRSAMEAYERLFEFKWTPPGRGLWMMGTEFVHVNRNSAALQNCAFVSTEKISSRSVLEATLPFIRLMEMSMLGVGVGFDTRGAEKLTIHKPTEGISYSTIEDSREGWVNSVGSLLESYFFENRPALLFDYEGIRLAGEPIHGFGGVAAGAGPLRDLHSRLKLLLDARVGQKLSSTDIVDINNLIGRCVVAGNVRRSAELALGEADDKAFLDLKNWEVNPERMGADGWGHISNNSVIASVNGDYDHLVDRISMNGEPGLIYLDLCRQYGRLIDPPNDKDRRVMGVNPCAEQSLESMECCTLVETYPVNNESYHDFERTLKYAYLYAKSVTLLPTHWPESNEVMQRNHRIGTSVSGSAQFAERFGWTELRTWLNKGYEVIQHRDRQYSEWLGVRESIKTTSVKPSGTVSLIAGVTPGVHWPTADIYIRRMRFAANDPLIAILSEAGYKSEPEDKDPLNTVVMEFPVRGPEVRTEREVSVWEKAHLAILHQRYWADNQVSVTLTFQDHERDQVGAVLRATEGQLKSICFLPIGEVGAYAQMPYERITNEEYEHLIAGVRPVAWDTLYKVITKDAEGEYFCSNDTCDVLIPGVIASMTAPVQLSFASVPSDNV